MARLLPIEFNKNFIEFNALALLALAPWQYPASDGSSAEDRRWRHGRYGVYDRNAVLDCIEYIAHVGIG